jgi:hypothetical protein
MTDQEREILENLFRDDIDIDQELADFPRLRELVKIIRGEEGSDEPRP